MKQTKWITALLRMPETGSEARRKAA